MIISDSLQKRPGKLKQARVRNSLPANLPPFNSLIFMATVKPQPFSSLETNGIDISETDR